MDYIIKPFKKTFFKIVYLKFKQTDHRFLHWVIIIPIMFLSYPPPTYSSTQLSPESDQGWVQGSFHTNLAATNSPLKLWPHIP